MTDNATVIRNAYAETDLKTSDFDFELPPELIAQTPLLQRDSSRLLVVDRKTGHLTHTHFHEMIHLLRPEDMLVVNASKVIPARLLGICDKNQAEMELLLLRARENGLWETLVRPGKRAKEGAVFHFGDTLSATVAEVLPDGNRLVSFGYDSARFRNIYEVLEEVGNMPLPPYIKEKLADKNRYQTVYAKEEGSAAAPTAGLHFTEDLLQTLKAQGVGYGEVTLHVGLGTFRPVKADHIRDHVMHTEHFVMTGAVAEEINARKRAGGRIVAVGTTSCRVLESVSDAQGTVHEMEGETGIFIFPGYQFKAVDALITNFHLPQSTLLMLVSALAGKELIMRAYHEAIAQSYRFFSFGDAMLIQ